MEEKKVYRYPYTLIAESTDYLQIDIVEYKPIMNEGNNSIVNAPGARRNQNGVEKKKIILLPIPSNISDSNSTKYGDSNLNSIGGALVGGIMGVMQAGAGFKQSMKEGSQNVIDKGKATIASITTNAGGTAGLQGFLTRQLASEAAGIAGVNITPDQLLARTTGEILNPNMELLFNGPSLRSFRFSFKMTPRNQPEADEIRNIIRIFKKHMAPKVSSAGDTTNTTFLKTPDVFQLRYRQGVEEHQFLNKFKQCFMESINVSYTADGTYATYEDGTPVSMVMDLSFKEIEPVYDVDYNGNFSGVGY
tara:strand:- start:77 stop:991 length:915 start_codon:yes stop_codon:yes gene_type:complete